MKAKELLLECKVRLKVESNYALAQKLELHRGLVSDYMNGKRVPDSYACFRIAEALQRDPAEIIAQIQAEDGGSHAEYFRDFMLRHGLAGLAAVSLLTSSAFYAPESVAAEPTEVRIMYK